MAGCAAFPLSGCPGGGEDRLVAELLLGRNIGDRLGVSEMAFRRFTEAEVTPRFPDGFTLLDSRGQYRDRLRNRIVQEPGKILIIVLHGEQDLPRVREVAEAYKDRFQQQSVGILTHRTCASF